MQLGNTGFTFVEELDMSEISTTYKHHRRLSVFYQKGLQCSAEGCPCVGTRLIVGKDKTGGRHVDVYTDDLMLMTVDHHVPVSRGGSDHMSNKFPMCRFHNTRKGNRVKGDTPPSNPKSKSTKRTNIYTKRWRKFVRKHASFQPPQSTQLVYVYKKVPVQKLHVSEASTID